MYLPLACMLFKLLAHFSLSIPYLSFSSAFSLNLRQMRPVLIATRRLHEQEERFYLGRNKSGVRKSFLSVFLFQGRLALYFLLCSTQQSFFLFNSTRPNNHTGETWGPPPPLPPPAVFKAKHECRAVACKGEGRFFCMGEGAPSPPSSDPPSSFP